MLFHSKFATAWCLALAPVILFIPAFMLAGMGPCTFSHPIVLVLALLLFVCLEVAAILSFVKAARSDGRVVRAMIGLALALILLVFNAALGYYVTAEYWADSQFSQM